MRGFLLPSGMFNCNIISFLLSSRNCIQVYHDRLRGVHMHPEPEGLQQDNGTRFHHWLPLQWSSYICPCFIMSEHCMSSYLDLNIKTYINLEGKYSNWRLNCLCACVNRRVNCRSDFCVGVYDGGCFWPCACAQEFYLSTAQGLSLSILSPFLFYSLSPSFSLSLSLSLSLYSLSLSLSLALSPTRSVRRSGLDTKFKKCVVYAQREISREK